MFGHLRFTPLLPLCAICILSLGCGGKDYQVAPVSGQITLDGKPLANADVGFFPTADAKQPFSFGRTDDHGNYTLRLQATDSETATTTEGAVVGEHRVAITVDRSKVKTGPLPKTKMAMRGRADFAAGTHVGGRFTEQCTVPSGGKSDANFDLKSK